MKIGTDLKMAKSSEENILKHNGLTGSIKIKGKSTGRPKIIKERYERDAINICKQH